jgi:aminocarboxymuconate-semialdehyde decarboxylase
MRTIDVHSHYVPSEVLARARTGAGIDGLRAETVDGEEWLVHRQGFRYPVPRSFWDVEARLAAMDASDTDQVILSVAPTLFMYNVDPGLAAEHCRGVNDSLARAAADSGGRIVPVAALPLQDVDAAVAELRHAVTEQGMRGAEISTNIGDTFVDHPSMRPVLATAQELGVPLILHPWPFGPQSLGTSDFYLNNLVGNPLMTVICAARLIFSGVLDELEDLSLVLMHGGGYLPYQIGRLDHGTRVRPEARACRHDPSAYLGRFAFDTLTHATAPLEFLIDLVGADHVVYGTDYAFDMGGGPLADQLAGIELDAKQHEDIAWRTAARLFSLEETR